MTLAHTLCIFFLRISLFFTILAYICFMSVFHNLCVASARNIGLHNKYTDCFVIFVQHNLLCHNKKNNTFRGWGGGRIFTLTLLEIRPLCLLICLLTLPDAVSLSPSLLSSSLSLWLLLCAAATP